MPPQSFLLNYNGRPLSTSFAQFDRAESLKVFIEAEKDLFANNFPQVVLAHVASAMAANYLLIVNEFDGCATPVLKGYPVSGKTTALT